MLQPEKEYQKHEKKESHFALFSIRKELKLFWQLGGIPYQIHLSNFGVLETQQLLEYSKLAVFILLLILPSLMLLSVLVIDPDVFTNNSWNCIENISMYALYFIPISQILWSHIVWKKNKSRMAKLCEKVTDINHKLEMYFKGSNVQKKKNKKAIFLFFISYSIGVMVGFMLVVYWYYILLFIFA